MIQWVAAASTGSILLLKQLIFDQVFKTKKVVIFKQQQRQGTDLNPKLSSDPATRLQVQFMRKSTLHIEIRKLEHIIQSVNLIILIIN